MRTCEDQQIHVSRYFVGVTTPTDFRNVVFSVPDTPYTFFLGRER